MRRGRCFDILQRFHILLRLLGLCGPFRDHGVYALAYLFLKSDALGLALLQLVYGALSQFGKAGPASLKGDVLMAIQLTSRL